MFLKRLREFAILKSIQASMLNKYLEFERQIVLQDVILKRRPKRFQKELTDICNEVAAQLGLPAQPYDFDASVLKRKIEEQDPARGGVKTEKATRTGRSAKEDRDQVVETVDRITNELLEDEATAGVLADEFKTFSAQRPIDARHSLILTAMRLPGKPTLFIFTIEARESKLENE